MLISHGSSANLPAEAGLEVLRCGDEAPPGPIYLIEGAAYWRAAARSGLREVAPKAYFHVHLIASSRKAALFAAGGLAGRVAAGVLGGAGGTAGATAVAHSAGAHGLRGLAWQLEAARDAGLCLAVVVDPLPPLAPWPPRAFEDGRWGAQAWRVAWEAAMISSDGCPRSRLAAPALCAVLSTSSARGGVLWRGPLSWARAADVTWRGPLSWARAADVTWGEEGASHTIAVDIEGGSHTIAVEEHLWEIAALAPQ